MACGAKQWNNDFFFINAEPLAAWREEARSSCRMDTAAAKCGGRTKPGTVPAVGLQGGEEAGRDSGGFAEADEKGGLPSPAVALWGSLQQARAEPRALLWLRSLSVLCSHGGVSASPPGLRLLTGPLSALQSPVVLEPSKEAWKKCHPRRLQSIGAVSALDRGRTPGYPPSDLCSAALGTGSGLPLGTGSNCPSCPCSGPGQLQPHGQGSLGHPCLWRV